jgi:DNA-binding response OmpR family regulator
MPRLGGVELAAALRARQPGLRVLYLTGHPDRAAVDEGPAAGPVLMKPFTPDELAARVQAVRGAGA